MSQAVSRPALYRRFADRRGLVMALIGAVLFRVALRNAALSDGEIETLVDQAIEAARGRAGAASAG